MRWHITVLLLVLAALGAGSARADLLIYDDALRNGFEDWSWGGGGDFANTSPVHAGSRSIRFAGSNYNAISMARPGAALGFTAYPELRFWIHGGASGGQQLNLILENDGASSNAVALGPYIAGGAPAANQWRLVAVPLATIPTFTALGGFNRIDIQSESAGAQPPLYLDDVVLKQSLQDLIFKSGFEGAAPPAGGLVITHDVPIDGLLGDRFSWKDAAGQPRVAVLAHNDGAAAGAGGSRGGELREFRYQVGGATRVIRPPTVGPGGFGYVVSHPARETSAYCAGGGDPSSFGHAWPGQFQRVFEGRHHAIFRFTVKYPRFCSESLPKPAKPYWMPVTIDWVFASGRDSPLWSITWDVAGAKDADGVALPLDKIADDSRAPYGELRIDGAASDAARAQIAGVAWGDYFRFSSTSAPVTFGSSWTWNQPNTIPFVKLWTQGVDATMGIVQSRSIQRQDAGGYWGQDSWNQTSATQPVACPDTGARMPCDYNWPFQSINYEIYGGPTQNGRIAWGTNFGFLGQAQYRVRGNIDYGGGPPNTLPGDPMAPGWPKKSYSTHIVLGTHSSDPVGRQVAETEVIEHFLTLAATVGSVATQGPTGIADATAMAYAPAGYDPVYGVLSFNAAGNQLDATLTIGAAAGARKLVNPLLVLRGWSGGLPTTVRLAGQALIADVDYFASPRPAKNELWITLKRELTAGPARRLEISP